MKKTKQIKTWEDAFGKKYTDRNPIGCEAMNEHYLKNFGISRTEMNKAFVNTLKRDSKILEVGCNVGSQLEILQQMGFNNLFGIDIQEYAVNLAKKRLKDVEVKTGSIFEIPYQDNSFDLVYTSGVLIHINPKDLSGALREITRCSNKYIWGFEYYSDLLEEIHYHGQNDLLWKDDFPKRYLDLMPNLKIVKKKTYQYLNSENKDVMFLLEKA